MNTLIVYCHPHHESLNGAFFKAVLKGIEESPSTHNVQVLDLYAENFNPVLVFNKDKKRRDMYKDPELEKHRQQIIWADRLVFIYPIFWGRPPAMLLGYIDRMFASQFAYKDRPRSPYPEGLLKGKQVVCISTMKGPSFYLWLTLNNSHKVLMKRALFSFVGIKKVKFFQFGLMESSRGNQSKKIAKVEHYFSKPTT
ncbi:NAD(P)H-dependent oxidoreductase [Neobacillus sp. SuZ13]|uniref:NAD(P)H-dependent oxidoreductase n=1 Tax=Neobacillus sp. SuZ13 TaxID=3047875 RepID=UPI0024C0DB4C|nr:NAD(P)H-dependent oxidoreductase [Neobacillus sp. SuZ13]WHY66557.1 NAD(P)H-dependent oxidoreductase [Neobacillus sp. SuZ13]